MYSKDDYDDRNAADSPVDVAAVFHKDNTVTPVAFWAPGGRRTRVDKIEEKLNAATFKEQGTGDRYRIRAKGVILYLFRIGDLWYAGHYTEDMRIPGIHTRYTGAYFGGKNVIDGRYDNPYKVPVDVSAVCYAIGDVVPDGFWWKDGAMYEIDRVNGWERAASVRAGIIGMRYSIRVRGRETYIYRDDDLWFMESKEGQDARVLDVHGRRVI
jgi:hypothetical protein